MNFNEYIQNTVLPLENTNEQTMAEALYNREFSRLLHASVGLNTEQAELQDAIKKYLIYGKSLDRVNAIEELGDIMWYVGCAIDALETTMEEVLQRNHDKLKARYGDRFTHYAALNRNLIKEREVLES